MFPGNSDAALKVIPVWSDPSITNVIHLHVDTFRRAIQLETTSSHYTIDAAPSIWHKRLTGVCVFGGADRSKMMQDEQIGGAIEVMTTCPDLWRVTGEVLCDPNSHKNGSNPSSTLGCDGDEVGGAHICGNRLCDGLEGNSRANPATILLFHETGLEPGTPSGRLGPTNSVANPGTILVNSTGLGTPSSRLDIFTLSSRLDILTSSSRLDILTPSSRLDILTPSRRLDILTSSCRLDIFTPSSRLDNFTLSCRLKQIVKTKSCPSLDKQFVKTKHCQSPVQYNVSFLKLILLILDGDVEVNPGPADNIGTPKGRGRKMKKRQFNFSTPKKLDMDNVAEDMTEINSLIIANVNVESRPIGLVNVRNDCFFNSVLQALFALPLFRNHVRNFVSHIPEERNAVRMIQQLFRYMEAKSSNPLQTHISLMSLGLPHYTEHIQTDAEECMTFIINLFYPRIDEVSNPRHNEVPDDSLFLLDGEESTLCLNCNKDKSKYYRESLSHIEFPDLNLEYSVQYEIVKMTHNEFGERLTGDNLFKCENCRRVKPNGTDANRGRTLMNLNKYMIVQLKTFGYGQISGPFKKIPKLQIEEQVNTILLGKLNLCAVVYHLGDSPIQGHYVASVKYGDSWYTCNDTIITHGVKLNCDPRNERDPLIPYLYMRKNLQMK